jgi:hypothetical protein
LSADDPPGPAEGAFPRLDPALIRRIEFAGWEERGPVLEIDARLIPAAGEPVPCRLELLWRLREPKILGAYP